MNRSQNSFVYILPGRILGISQWQGNQELCEANSLSSTPPMCQTKSIAHFTRSCFSAFKNILITSNYKAKLTLGNQLGSSKIQKPSLWPESATELLTLAICQFLIFPFLSLILFLPLSSVKVHPLLLPFSDTDTLIDD